MFLLIHTYAESSKSDGIPYQVSRDKHSRAVILVAAHGGCMYADSEEKERSVFYHRAARAREDESRHHWATHL